MDQTIRIVVDSKGAERGTRVVNRSLDKLRTEARGATADVDKISGAFNRTGKSAKGFSGVIKSSAISVASFGKSLLFAGGAVAAVGLFTGALKDAVAVGATFEKSLAELSAITGASGDDLGALSKAARDLGKTTTSTATQVSTAFKLIASAKPELLENQQALIDTTEAALTLAEASGLALPDAVKALTGSLNQFGAGAEEAGRFINVLAAGSKLGAVEVPQLTQALKVSGTVAAAAGLSFEQTIAALEALGEAELKGAEGGTGFRNVILGLTATSLPQLEVRTFGLTGALKNLNATVLAGLSPLERDNALLKIFGRESLAAVQALLVRIKRTEDLETAVTGTTTAFEQQLIATDSLEDDIKRLGSAYEGVQLSLSDGVIPNTRSATKALADFLNLTSSGIDSINELAGALGETLGGAFRTNQGILTSLEGATVEQLQLEIERQEKVVQSLKESADNFNLARSTSLFGLFASVGTSGNLREAQVQVAKLKTLRDEANASITGTPGGSAEDPAAAVAAAAADAKAAAAAKAAARIQETEAKKEARNQERLGAKIVREATDDIQEQADALQSLRDELDPIGAKTKEYTQNLSVLNQALAQGTIEDDEFTSANIKLSEAFEKARDPLSQLNEKLQEEAELLKLSSKERGVEVSVRQAVADLQRQGLELTDDEIDGIRQRTAANVEANETLQRQNSLLAEIKSANENFGQEQADINKLQKDGKITTDEQAQALSNLRDKQLAASTDLADGFERGFRGAKESFNDFASTSEAATTRLFSTMQSGLADFVKTGKTDFSSLKDSIIDSIIQIGTQAAISDVLNGFGGGGGSTNGSGGAGGGLAGIAGAFFGGGGGGGLPAFGDGGVQATDTLARIAEKGPEAVIPLKGGNVPVTIKTGSQPVSMTNNFNFSNSDEGSFKNSESQVLDQFAMSLAAIQTRNSG